MDSLGSLLTSLNSLSPLAVIALLALVLFYQAKNSKHAASQTETLTTMRGNDLHELPEIAADIRTLVDAIQRIETSNAANFSAILARLDTRFDRGR